MFGALQGQKVEGLTVILTMILTVILARIVVGDQMPVLIESTARLDAPGVM
jgi:hypothetical protein